MTNRYYKNNTNDYSISRTIYGVLNSDNIVCIGFCELLKEIIVRLNLKNVRLFSNDVQTLVINRENSLHRNIALYIKDEKYNVDGYFYLDPTWDCGKSHHLNFFLLPLNEIKNINEYSIEKDNVNYSGYYEYSTNIDGRNIFNRPVFSDKISLYNNGIITNEEFDNFNNSKFVRLKKPDALFNSICLKNKNLSLDNFYKLLYCVIDKKENGIDKQKKAFIIKNIINENISFSKKCFNNNSNTIFKQCNSKEEKII